MSNADILLEVWEVINDRIENPPEQSYVHGIISHRKGIDKALEKVGEEAIEFILAMKNDSDERKISEAADLIFHILLALRAGNIDINDVLAELETRRK
jgi:phosphoribosyl-ATP pyrophosphohydrolase